MSYGIIHYGKSGNLYAPDRLVVKVYGTQEAALEAAKEIPHNARIFRKGRGYDNFSQAASSSLKL